MRSSRDPRRRAAPARLLVGVAAAVVLVATTACTSDPDDEPPPQLDRIDRPAQVDQDRLDGQPGAVSDDESGG